MRPVLLCYQLEERQAMMTALTAMRLGIRVRTVQPSEYGQTLAALCGLEAAGDAEGLDVGSAGAERAGAGFSDAMLVLAGFPDGLASVFLNTLRRGRVPPVALKAMLTETNAAWDSERLHRELCAERDALAKGLGAAHDAGTQA